MWLPWRVLWEVIFTCFWAPPEKNTKCCKLSVASVKSCRGVHGIYYQHTFTFLSSTLDLSSCRARVLPNLIPDPVQVDLFIFNQGQAIQSSEEGTLWPHLVYPWATVTFLLWLTQFLLHWENKHWRYWTEGHNCLLAHFIFTCMKMPQIPIRLLFQSHHILNTFLRLELLLIFFFIAKKRVLRYFCKQNTWRNFSLTREGFSLQPTFYSWNMSYMENLTINTWIG